MKHEAKIKQIIELIYSEIDHIGSVPIPDRTIADTNKLVKYYSLLMNDEEELDEIDFDNLTDAQLEKLAAKIEEKDLI